MKAKSLQINALKKKIAEEFRAVLLFGPDFSVVSDLTQQIIHLILPHPTDFSLIKISENQLEKNPSLLIDEANTISFGTERKIIWLKNGDNKQTEAVKFYMENIKTNAFLLITAENLMKNSSLRLFCENHAQILAVACYEDSENDTRFMIKEILNSNRYTYSDDVLETLTAKLNENRLTTKNELEKLMTYMGNCSEITIKDVENVIPNLKNSTMEKLCFHTAGGDQDQADKATKILLENNENEISIVRNLGKYFNKLLIGRELYEKKQGTDFIFKKLLRANQYMYKETFLSQIRIWNREMLLKTLILLSETEEQLKTTGTPAATVLHRCVTMIGGLARKLKRQSF